MGSSSSSKRIRTSSTLLTGQRSILDDLLDLIGPEIGRAGFVPQTFAVPGASPLQQQAFEQVAGLGASPLGQARNTAFQSVLGLGDPNTANQFFNQAVAEPALRQFNQQILPSVFERFTGGGFGRAGGVLEAAGQTAQNFASDLSAQRANFQLAGQQAALAGADASLRDQLAGITALGQFGTQQRGIEAQMLQEQLQRELAGQPLFNPALQFALPLVNIPAFAPFQGRMGGTVQNGLLFPGG